MWIRQQTLCSLHSYWVFFPHFPEKYIERNTIKKKNKQIKQYWIYQMHMSRIDGSLIWTHHYYRVLIYRYILMHPGWMTQGTVHQCLLSGDLVGREPRTTLCSVTISVFIYNRMKMWLCFKYLFTAFISAVFPLAGLFPCIYASWVSHPFILSVCSLLVLSFCEPSPDAFQACGEKLWLRLVSWLEGCASNCVPGPG